MQRLGGALTRLDPESRALLDLSLRRGLSDAEIAAVRRTGAEEVAERRTEVLERLFDELGLRDRAARDEAFASLPDLPDPYWRGQTARA